MPNLLILLSLWGVGASPQPKLMEQIRESFKPYQEFRVEFKQEVVQDLFADQPGKAEGWVELKKPNEMKWVYEKPEKKVILFKDSTLKVDGEIVQAEGGISLEESFGFLWGQVDQSLFNIELRSKNQLRLLVKKGIKTSFKFIDLRVKNKRVSEAIVFDHLDGKSHLRFSGWKFQ